jgi:MoaA/NifB/PqqE/SkfB family radical SAM enzyme
MVPPSGAMGMPKQWRRRASVVGRDRLNISGSRTLKGLWLAGRIARARALSRPLILSHLVTARCNAACSTCLWRDQTVADLGLEEVRWLYRQSGRLGIPQLVVWGGEPLLREDLPLLLEEARRTGHFVTLISNGWLLPDRWPEIRGLVDALILSLDEVGEEHDRMRGVPGLFARVEESVARVQRERPRPRLFLNTVLSQENPGALRRVAEVARGWQAGLFFCPMETGQMRTGGFAPLKEELSLPPEQLREAARLADLLARSGYPLMSSSRYRRLLEQDPALTDYRCHVPRAILTVTADGGVRDCLRRDRPLARVQELAAAGRSLEEVLRSPRYRELVRESASCTACNNPDVLETSWLWELRPVMLERVFGLARA